MTKLVIVESPSSIAASSAQLAVIVRNAEGDVEVGDQGSGFGSVARTAGQALQQAYREQVEDAG